MAKDKLTVVLDADVAAVLKTIPGWGKNRSSFCINGWLRGLDEYRQLKDGKNEMLREEAIEVVSTKQHSSPCVYSYSTQKWYKMLLEHRNAKWQGGRSLFSENDVSFIVDHKDDDNEICLDYSERQRKWFEDLCTKLKVYLERRDENGCPS